MIEGYNENIESIFKAYPPFQKLDNGYGYKGILLRDTVNDLIQCHQCGQWKSFLPSHLCRKHKIGAMDYKIKFGLPMTYPLCARGYSRIQSIKAIKNKNYVRLAEARKVIKNSKYGSKASRSYSKNSPAWLNKYAICKEQVLRRYVTWADELGKEPSSSDLQRIDYKLLAAIFRHYGRFNKFKDENGFEVVKKYPTYKDDKLISLLRKFAKENHKMPRARYFNGSNSNGYPSHETYRARFGSWNRAIELAGFHAS